MRNDVAAWSISCVLVSVSDLDRSTVFYQDVMNVREVFREDQIAILGESTTGSFSLLLREADRGATRSGQQSLGIRSLMCDVGSNAELDRVEVRLRARDAFRDRQLADDVDGFEFVIGHDPDRLPLMFTARTGKTPSLDDYHRGLARMYAVDV